MCVSAEEMYCVHSSNGAMRTHMVPAVGTAVWEHKEGTHGELGGF